MRLGLLSLSFLACLGMASVVHAFDPVEAVMQGGDADINQFTNTPSFPTGMEINGAFYNSYGNFSFNSYIPNSQIDGSSITKQGNTFNIANRLLLLNSVGQIPNSLINASSITLQGNTFNGASQLLKTDSNSALSISSLTVSNTKLFDSGFQVLPIVQIQSYTTSTSSAVVSSVFTNTRLSGSFTPKFSSSKLLIWINGDFGQVTGGSVGYLTIARNGTSLASTNGGFALTVANNFSASAIVYDSPATTSAITYAVQIRTNGGGTASFPITDGGSFTSTATMLIVEIAQ